MECKSTGLADLGLEPRLARGYVLLDQVLEKEREEVGGKGLDISLFLKFLHTARDMNEVPAYTPQDEQHARQRTQDTPP